MNIDFIKLLKLLFPTFLRSGTIGALLTAIGTDLNALYTSFKNWQTDARLQAAITCQVMYMEAIINYRLFGNFHRTIYITDGDAVTVDFHVNITPGVTVNGQLLISLIKKYKLVGKRYDVVQSTVTYSAEWTDFVCELNELIYTSEWSDFVCELVEETQTLIDNYITLTYTENGSGVGVDFTVTAQYPVASTIIVELDHYGIVLIIQAGTTTASETQTTAVDGSSVSIQNLYISGTSNTSDNTYNYLRG